MLPSVPCFNSALLLSVGLFFSISDICSVFFLDGLKNANFSGPNETKGCFYGTRKSTQYSFFSTFNMIFWGLLRCFDWLKSLKWRPSSNEIDVISINNFITIWFEWTIIPSYSLNVHFILKVSSRWNGWVRLFFSSTFATTSKTEFN